MHQHRPGDPRPATEPRPWFSIRGVVLVVRDLQTLDWPTLAKQAGLTAIGTHIFPHEVATFLDTDTGQAFLESCRTLGIQVEHELHAVGDLLPRDLFGQNPDMFRMNGDGDRVPDYNLCPHSETGMGIVCENAARYAERLPSTTGRYFYWIDDGKPMCRCPACHGFSDADQALMVENHMLGAIRQIDDRATLAHLAYATTLAPPTQVTPTEGIFLEFAPISRRYDRPFEDREARAGETLSHGEMLDLLDANLALFGVQDAQVLEYWLDLSRFSGWRRDNVMALPWNRDVCLADLSTYASRGIRNVTTFAAWLDSDYVARFGMPPISDYGQGVLDCQGPR